MGSKLVQMCQMCSSLSKTCSNVFRCLQNCSKITRLFSARGPTWQAVLDLVYILIMSPPNHDFVAVLPSWSINAIVRLGDWWLQIQKTISIGIFVIFMNIHNRNIQCNCAFGWLQIQELISIGIFTTFINFSTGFIISDLSSFQL